MPALTLATCAVHNLINGNLTDAKKQAARLSHRAIREAYQNETGCADRTAVYASDYLKGACSFQEYCDVKHEEGDRH